MTYETKIGIEIERIRRFIRVEIDYHVETVDGKRQPVQDAIRLLSNEGPMPGSWVCLAAGPRQLRELDGRLLEDWDSQRRPVGPKRKR